MWQAIIWTNVDPIHWRIYAALGRDELIHWGRVVHSLYVPANYAIFGLKNGFLSYQRQAINWTHADNLLIRALEANSNDLFCKIYDKTSHAILNLPLLNLPPHVCPCSHAWILCSRVYAANVLRSLIITTEGTKEMK